MRVEKDGSTKEKIEVSYEEKGEKLKSDKIRHDIQDAYLAIYASLKMLLLTPYLPLQL